MTIGFTKKAQNALNRALAAASEMGHSSVGSEHLLLGLLSERDGIAARVLEEQGVTFDKVRRQIGETVGFGEPSVLTPGDITPRVKRIIEASASIAVGMGHGYIGTEHLLLAAMDEEECYAARLVREAGSSPADVKRGILAVLSAGGERQKNAAKKHLGDTLSQYGVDLCERAREGKLDPIIGREEETARLVQILSRRTKNNPCLIGEPGVGKTAVVEGLAQRIAEDAVPETLAGRRIVTLDLSAMVAGAKYRGEFEERMKNVLAEVKKNPSVILFIDEIHTIIGAGGAEGAVDAANILKPALARGEIQVIGATTIDEYRKHIERDAALERRFQSVTVGEPSAEEAERILFGLRDKYEAHHKLKITDEAIRAAVALSVRYIGDRYLPDKAIDLVDEAASRKRIAGFNPPPDVKELEEKLRHVTAEKEEAILGEDYEGAARLRDEEKRLTDDIAAHRSGAQQTEAGAVDADDIAEIVTAWTHIPVKRLAEEESERLLHLDRILKERIIGQDAAVDAVARAIRRGRMGLKDPRRPIGSFLFLGPTGVGKTELSKALADVMFGDAAAMIRVDMSEYMEKHSVSKMIGSPPGYVGYDDGGQLTERVRRQPYSVVLFDEIEKAHPDVFNILLQILEDGCLTDSRGRHVDFRNTVVIMTSNVGAQGITEPKRLGFVDAANADAENAKMRAGITEALKRTFRPEFLNRVDEVIVFNKLTDRDIAKIASLMLDEERARIEGLGISVEFGEDVIESLAREGFDPVYGARPLRRAITRRIEDSFSEAMLGGIVSSGDRVRAILGETGGIAYERVGERTE
ncbi:MAG: ATP-dependent Clp protease ATP-binding subunit [Clostridiales bacterium]|nr:ATP-dependent Clp protease ATP-binding subunit [Clostridiales bacterium]